MKNIELFCPRSSLIGMYSYVDIPKIRIQIANKMMFCKYNEMEDMKKAVISFKPTVRFIQAIIFVFLFLHFLRRTLFLTCYKFSCFRFMENKPSRCEMAMNDKRKDQSKKKFCEQAAVRTNREN